jgi:hypothetical protein
LRDHFAFVDPRSATREFFRHINFVNTRQPPQLADDNSIAEYRWISPGMKDLLKSVRNGDKLEQILRGYTLLFHEDFLMRVILFAGVIVSDILNPGFWNPKLLQSAEFRILSPDRGIGKSDVRRLIQDGISAPNRGRCFPTTNISVGLPLSPFFFQPRFPIHLPSFTLSVMSSNNHAVQADRPERSRNAKAQARHRAKRKAYIEQVYDSFSAVVNTEPIPLSSNKL